MVRPNFSIEIDGKELSEEIKGLVQSIEITDEVDTKSDSCSVSFIDRDGIINPPKKGVSLVVFLGYDNNLKIMGRYTVSGVNGKDGILKVRAKGFDQNKKIKSTFDGEYTNKTIAEMVEEVAKRNNLKAKISEDFKTGTRVEVQKNESDLSFLSRLAKENRATMKVQGSEILFIKKGEGKASDGRTLPSIGIQKENILDWNYNDDDHDDVGEVTACYVVQDKGIDEKVSVGSGEPRKKLDTIYSSEADARAAINSFLFKSKKSKETLTIDLIGDPNIKSERRIKVDNLRAYANGEWITTTVRHTLESGYKTSLTLKKILSEEL